MNNARVIPLPAGPHRRPLQRAVDARRQLDGRGGRAWINGREVGGADRHFSHLGRSHD